MAVNACGEIVVGEIGIEGGPCARHGMHAEIKQPKEEHAAFQPEGNGVMIRRRVHT